MEKEGVSFRPLVGSLGHGPSRSWTQPQVRRATTRTRTGRGVLSRKDLNKTVF